ncbi:hypothetical protein MRGA327_20955 [Mycobacterium tuberculosis RGTB327]|nr:hypothetical protein MRGA423_21395 [Mycobacterium tuberculosis RGTB423]AFE18189.1 hypothetical protein MRGA327_20955 [Mycobacterium tuberculosis RGTB327]
MPVAVGDQQGAAFLTGTGHHCPRPRPRHPAPSQTEHHQIHAVDQHSGHLNRIGPGIWYHREPAQIRPHLHRGQQPDIRLANDGRVSPGRRHRCHHAQQQ